MWPTQTRGKADCPYYAKAELLADYLQGNLPDFRVHKITQHPDKWEQWLHDICAMNGWEHRWSPIIWRELLDRGGKGLLLGGLNDFLEYAQQYYGITSMMLNEEMLDIAEENLRAHIEIEKEEEEIKGLIKPLQIWITSASAPICYQLVPVLASGEVFGMSTEISIHLLDTDEFKEVLYGIVMEAEDMAFPLLCSISEHTEMDEAFIQADIIIVLDDVLLNCEVQSHENYIREVSEICQVYAPLIEKNAKSEVRIISSGKTFVNLKAMMIMTYGPSIKPQNVIAIATSWESAAKAMLARKLNMNTAGVKDVVVWGNITGSNYIDLSHAKLYGYDSAIWGPPNFPRPLLNMLYDSEWIHSEFLSARSSLSSRVSHCVGMLPAHAVATVLRYWYHDSPPGEIISVGILSEGQFCVPEGIVFSMPVRFRNGNWEVMTELEINETTQEVLGRLAHELVQEKLIALKEIKEMQPYGADKITSEKYLCQEMENLPTGPL
ncbi:putative malate dehydrogenase 1B isoform X2 [Tyto alba]|uniref:putative malate dehydrogenase 1B isoform X2 n=1 Tax=Tyto alba TaxID=56313 RepID=UPI001403FE0C|nr:putative malate dehydrogenase 1B isoform X2 [Tyto alba]XP_032866871.1 putative malate dehydrogenase 1B isoform X2 [Tyto alba]